MKFSYRLTFEKMLIFFLQTKPNNSVNGKSENR